MDDAVARAEKKLRQAEFFVAHLDDLSKQPNYRSPADPEHLEFFFSAALTAAQSVYYVLNHSGRGAFQKIRSKWYKNLNEQRSFFDKMKNLRDGDVHHASTDAEPLPRYVEADLSRQAPYYQSSIHNPALFGERLVIEEQNPDGEKVSAHELGMSIGLYIKQKGKYVAASTACRQFISLLRSLLDAVRNDSQNSAPSAR
jgi:hypothetical protein